MYLSISGATSSLSRYQNKKKVTMEAELGFMALTEIVNKLQFLR